MRKISYLFLSTLMVLSSSLFISCEDDEKDPFIIEEQEENFAPYVRIVVSTPVVDATALDGVVYSGVVDIPRENVASWDVQIRKIRGADTIPYAPLATFTSFPSDLDLTGQDIADALGIPTTEIQPGDNIQFNAVSTGTGGGTLRFEDLGPDLFGQPEQRQAFFFNVFVACPFIQADAVGTYDVTQHRFDAFFGAQPPTREIVAGPDANSYTIVGGALPLDGADDLTINVNPSTGQVSAGNPDDIHFNTFGPGVYGSITGFTFSCVGFIDLAITSPGFITNFFTLQKQ